MSACNIDQMNPPQSWIISIGCAGIVLGLWTLGKRVIKTVGKDIAKITPARYVHNYLGYRGARSNFTHSSGKDECFPILALQN